MSTSDTPSSQPSMSPAPSIVHSSQESMSILPSNEPSIDPSMSMIPSSCDNNANFSFKLDNGNIQDCVWLTSRAKKIVRRKERYCERDNVVAACQLFCDSC